MAPTSLLILDVDGVMTGGRLPYSAAGNEIKAFYVQDGGAVGLWQAAGGVVAVISGRESRAVDARAKDLGIEMLVQGVPDKVPAYETFCRQAGVSDEAVCVIGDDFLDIAPMQRCGYPIAVANAIPQVKRAARYVPRRRGGDGAIAVAVERVLRRNGVWAAATARFSE